ncbi:MAG: sugar transferase [Anaerolineaceae bacterium]|jgi:exopolysaccharide biosynthesis polyprenyl glycosylphosphotransferase
MQEKNTSPRLRLQPSEHRFILILGDIIAAVLALFIALYLWSAGDTWMNFSLEFLRTRPDSWFYFLPVIWIALMVDNYDLNKAGSLKLTLRAIGLAILVASMLYLIVYFTMPPKTLPRRGVAYFIIFVSILTLLWRVIYVRIFSAAIKSRRLLVIGAGKAGSALVNVLADQVQPPYNLLGLIDDDPEKLGTKIRNYQVLGDHSQLLTLVRELGVTDLILAISGQMNHGMFQNLLTAQEKGLQISTMAQVYEELLGRVPINLLDSEWVVRSFVDRAQLGGIYRLLKRLLDVILTIIALAFFIVLFPIIAVLILIDSGRPVIYSQERLGRGGEPYRIYKFRTMKNKADMEKEALVTAYNDARITRLGKFLRKVHLDELPQVINVMKGEMSWVGPRSERSELVAVFQQEVPFYRARMLLKPGITGWAQIHQRYAETIEETAVKLEYDLYYIEHANLLMDISIILRTFGSVLGFKGR